MSKAFTRESDEPSEEAITALRAPAASGVKRHITKQGIDRLRQQANDLLEEKRALLSRGSAENPDTTARVRRLDAAIQRIQQVLDSVIAAEPPADSGKVGFGAFVRIRDQHGDEETYQIVGPDESDPGQGRISSISPLAQALLNGRAGDAVRFRSPAGDQQLTILSVRY